MTITIEKALAAWLRGISAISKTFADAIEAARVPELPTPPARRGVLVPLYSRDPVLWDRLYAAASKVDVIAVVNPDSGPSTAVSSFWSTVVGKSAATPGMTAIGYVSTRYGNRPSAEVFADIATWYRLYPAIKGVFFDEQSTKADQVGKYAAFFADVRKRGGYVATNPGIPCDPGYLSQGKPDTIVLWENTAAVAIPPLPAWALAAPDAACSILLHDCDDVQAAALVPSLRAGGFGLVFVTSSPGWSTLGTYFDELIA